MVLELAKIVLPILGGGLAGAFLKERYDRNRNRLQRIPLIERVNQLVRTDLEGITLARKHSGDEDDPAQLQEVSNLREYQLTLRNNSSVHLRDAEIQFEFPAEDVIARVQRPVLSKTSLEAIPAVASEQWRKAFRWSIPHLPSGDSVEFTFQAIDSPSGDYEVALYNTERVIIEKVSGEPATDQPVLIVRGSLAQVGVLMLLALFVVGAIGYPIYGLLYPDSGYKSTNVLEGGCVLSISSKFDGYKTESGNVWRTETSIFNQGSEDCIIRSSKFDSGNVSYTIHQRDDAVWHKTSQSRPKLQPTDLAVGADASHLKTLSVELY